MKPGDRILLEAPSGRLGPFMQQVRVDIDRAGMTGLLTQSHVLGVEVATRAVLDIVLVSYRSNDVLR